MGVCRLLVVVAGAGVLAACSSTDEPYSATPLKAAPAVDRGARDSRMRASPALDEGASDSEIQVGPDGPMMTAKELQAERLRRMHDRVRTNPGLIGKMDDYVRPDGDYVDVLRR